MRGVLKYGIVLLVGILIGVLFFGKKEGKQIANTAHPLRQESQIWTCAMHPEILRQEPGQCPICGMDLTPVNNVASELSVNQIQMSPKAQALGNVQTTTVGGVGKDKGASGITLSGQIVASEKGNAIQTAHFGGRIEKLYVTSTGTTVHKGQLLALVYSPELLAAQQELLTTAKMKKVQPQLYDAVRKKLRLWKLSPMQIDQIEQSGKAAANFKIYANVSGVVTKKLVESGAHVMEGEALFEISNLSTVWAVFDVYESQIAAVVKGQKITLQSTAYPTLRLNATVSFIAPVLDAKTRTLQARVVLDNTTSLWKPGMFVTGSVKITSAPTIDISNTIHIPKTAVLWTGKESIVYVKPDPKQAIFEMREVTLGNIGEQFYEIIAGLRIGEEVVINGAFVVDAEAQLQGKKSMMNK